MTKTFEEIKNLESQYQLKTYAKFDVALTRGAGVYVYDSAGKKYLDLYGGHAVCIVGHCHPEVVAAVREQAGELMFYSNIVYHETRARAAQAVVEFAGAPYTKVFFCNSGAEANEVAIKLMRRHTQRETIVAFKGCFHGRTAGALSITGIDKYKLFPPYLPGVKYLPFGDIGALRELFKAEGKGVAGVILEPIQSMGGVRMAEPAYYKELRSLCDNNGAILTFDEVQTGFGRTGANFFGEHVAVKSDIITCAKGLGGGVPVGGVIVTEEIAAKLSLGEHGTTFGGGPLAAAAVEATIQVIRNEKLAHNACDVGAYLKAQLEELKLENVSEVRGLGLMIGIQFKTEAKKVIAELLHAGFIVGSSEDGKTVRLLPPLTITKGEVDQFLPVLKRVADEFK